MSAGNLTEVEKIFDEITSTYGWLSGSTSRTVDVDEEYHNELKRLLNELIKAVREERFDLTRPTLNSPLTFIPDFPDNAEIDEVT